MRKQASINFQPGHLSEAAMAASRQVWLAGLGAAVVTRDWVQNDAGTMLRLAPGTRCTTAGSTPRPGSIGASGV